VFAPSHVWIAGMGPPGGKSAEVRVKSMVASFAFDCMNASTSVNDQGCISRCGQRCQRAAA
jgi:hypothetical protein